MTTTILVLGDSVPAGETTAATPWPRRLPSIVDGLEDARVEMRGGMGTTLADLAHEVEQEIESVSSGGDRTVVFVHAGHNDVQLRGEEPRVREERFRAAAARADSALSDHPSVDRHAFVGLVPLLPGYDVSFADAQPERSLAYDDALAETVDDHLPVARPVDAWHDRTADGVHPDREGHTAIAERVGVWLAGRE